MNGEFHYYWTYILATQAGFNRTDAEILAIATQYPDENIDPVRVITTNGVYESTTTHHYGFWDQNAHISILVPFHFIPGNPDAASAVRRITPAGRWTVTPHSPIAKQMLIMALQTRNLYRIGIALHAYADTWAHQNFSGLNDISNQHPSGSVLPPIGHAQYGLKPDILHETWQDPRLENNCSHISNRQRFLDAAEMVYRYLCAYQHRDWADWFLVKDKIETLIGSPGQEKTPEERLLDYQIEYEAPPAARHSWKTEALDLPQSSAGVFTHNSVQEKLRWFRDEMLERSSLRERTTVKARSGFYESHWYNWMEAAREHRQAVQTLIETHS